MACIVLHGIEPGGAELARELFDWCHEQLAYFKVPG
jgi:hypothetical protein